MNRARQTRQVTGNGLIYMLALQAAHEFIQLRRKPPVTASLILVNSVIHWRPGVLNTILPFVEDVCLNPYLILKDADLTRLFLSAFYHLDDTHLILNMTSLMWEGMQLERSMGSPQFAGMVGILLGLSHTLVVVSAKLLDTFAHVPGPMYSECAVGFSAVLFALKVVHSWNSPGYTNMYGVLVPSRYATLAELALVHMFIPEASFIGHVCGILAGLIYVHGAGMLSGMSTFGWLNGAGLLRRTSALGWLKRLLHLPFSLLLWPFTRFSSQAPRGRTHGRGLVGSSSNALWRCPACTYDNRVISTMCSMCSTPRGNVPEHYSDEAEPPASTPREQNASNRLTVEELRRARLARLTRSNRTR